MPAIVVTSNADSGPGTLRQAIADVADGGTITFGGDMTIHLASTLTLGRDVTIDGAGHSVTISGDSNGDGSGDVRVFYVNSGVTATLQHITVTKGHANNGGGVYSDGALTVTNCTFAGNSATYGGGIHSKFGTVRNCTFSDNSAVSGSAIFNEGGMLAARNSIMVGSGPLCQDVSGADNLSSDGSCIGSSPSNILLGPLGDYGGGTQTIPLLPGSAAIDTGNPAICLATDQRGLARVGTCDIGAFESQGFALGDLTGTPQSTLVNTAFAQPLGLTVAANDPLEPVDGGLVTFTTPAEGANAVLSADTVTISGAAASATATANGTAGSYDVTAEAKGAASVPFALTNTPPVLALDAISPASAVAGSGDLSLAVTGSGFIDGSVVRWNGADLETTIAGETQLNALVPAGSLAAVQTAQVTVYTPWGGSSPVLAFFVTQAAAGVSGQDVVDGNNPAATYGPASAAATGEGLLAVAQYDANPGGTPSFTASGTYFDVYAAPGNTFTQVTIVACGLTASDKLFWWDTGQAKWQKASPQSYDPSTGCVTLVVDGSSSPTLSQLQGTFFASGNTAPTANPGGPYLGAINTAIQMDGSFSSDDDSDFLTYAWTYGDGATGTDVNPTHSYGTAGIYDVCLTVNDSTMDSDPACTLAVIYDPEGGFVTGGGWINSPAGAYRLDPTLSGKATFGFVSKYKKGTTVPEGNTEFQFQAGGFNFHSTAYDWLVVEGKTKAQFKGSGTVNDGLDPNENAYRFMLWAGDGAASGGSDTFRIRIWWEAGGVENDVYDNGFDQAIGGGSIVIHTK
jgi:predicted outer membrane repeat protein